MLSTAKTTTTAVEKFYIYLIEPLLAEIECCCTKPTMKMFVVELYSNLKSKYNERTIVRVFAYMCNRMSLKINKFDSYPSKLNYKEKQKV